MNTRILRITLAAIRATLASCLIAACVSSPPVRNSPYWNQTAGGIKSHGNVQIYSNFVVASGKRADGTYVIGTGRDMLQAMSEARPLPPMPKPTPKPVSATGGGASAGSGLHSDMDMVAAISEVAYAPGGGEEAVFIGLSRRAVARGLIRRSLYEIPGIKMETKSGLQLPGHLFLPEP